MADAQSSAPASTLDERRKNSVDNRESGEKAEHATGQGSNR